MTDSKPGRDLKPAFNINNINDDLEEAPSPPGANYQKPKREAKPTATNNAAANGNKDAQINSEDESEDSDNEGEPDVVLDQRDPNQPLTMFNDPQKSSMAQVLGKKIPDTKGHTVSSK